MVVKRFLYPETYVKGEGSTKMVILLGALGDIGVLGSSSFWSSGGSAVVVELLVLVLLLLAGSVSA